MLSKSYHYVKILPQSKSYILIKFVLNHFKIIYNMQLYIGYTMPLNNS